MDYDPPSNNGKIKKVVQGQIISRVKEGKVVDQVGGTREAVKVMIYKLKLCRKYSQVLMDMVEAEVVANPGVAVMGGMDSVDKQKFKKFEGLLSLFCSQAPQEETRGCTMQCILLVLLRNT